MSNTELVRVMVTPQNTADVFIGELHIKTFGGVHAHQAACDFAQQIKNELAKPVPVVIGTDLTEDKADAYKLETRGRRS